MSKVFRFHSQWKAFQRAVLRSSSRLQLIWFALCSTVFFLSCSTNAPTGPNNRISAEAPVQVATQSIGSGGGTLLYSDASDSLSGLRIDVPAGAITSSASFNVGVGAIRQHGFRSDVKLLTPLISFSNGGVMSKEPMTITIPIHNPSHRFALPFLYDEQTHKLEALSVVEQDSSKIRFLMSNFRNSKTAGILTLTEETHSSVVVLSTDAALLTESYDSGFQMGEDNCQFLNYGSEIAPSGHCGGQTIAAAWYYQAKKKKGSPGLFGLYDNDGIQLTPKIWQDDQALYRYCSLIQTHSPWSGLKYWDNNTSERDVLSYKSIAFAIRETGCPQPLYVFDGDKIAHAILATRVSNGIIAVADPNYFTESKIELNKRLGDFEPYNLSRYVGDTRFNCIHIYHASLSQITDLEYCAEQWNKVLDGTCGTAEFSKPRIQLLNKAGEYETVEKGKVIKINEHSTLELSLNGAAVNAIVFDRATQQELFRDQRDFVLSAGKHTIGVYCYSPTPKNIYGLYIGFQWIDVEVSAEEGPMSGDIALNLSINGAAAQVKKATFEIQGEPVHGYFLVINAELLNPNGAVDGFMIHSGLLVGGTYEGVPHPFTSWSHFEKIDQLATVYGVSDRASSTMKVLAWRPGVLDGSFDFSVVSEKDATKQAQCKGSFHLP